MIDTLLHEISLGPLQVLSWVENRLWKYSQGVKDGFWKSAQRLKRVYLVEESQTGPKKIKCFM